MAATDWAPRVNEVAAHIRARTKVAGGIEAGTFNENTRPTAEEVQALIPGGVRRVASRVGSDPCNEDLKADAKDLAAMLVAMKIELSYYPEQTRSDTSSFKGLRDLYKEGMKDLVEAVRDTCGGSGGDGAVGAAVLPVDSFPEEPILGRHTQDW